jgi:hypothetical protein
VTLISDVEHAAYSGMLPGHISGIYRRDEMMIDLAACAALPTPASFSRKHMESI